MADNKKIRSDRFTWGAGDVIIRKPGDPKPNTKPDEKKKSEK